MPTASILPKFKSYKNQKADGKNHPLFIIMPVSEITYSPTQEVSFDWLKKTNFLPQYTHRYLETNGHYLVRTALDNKTLAGIYVVKKVENLDLLLYLSVHKNYRSKGIGSNLLQQFIEDTKQAGRKAEAIFQTAENRFQSLCRFLDKNNSNRIISKLHLFKGERSLFPTPSTNENNLSLSSVDIKPFSYSSLEELKKYIPVAQKMGLSPLQDPDKISDNHSFILYHNGIACGWIITHKVGEQQLRITSCFVDQSALGRNTITAIHVLSQKVLSQLLKDNESTAVGLSIDARNSSFLAFFKKRYGAYSSWTGVAGQIALVV